MPQIASTVFEDDSFWQFALFFRDGDWKRGFGRKWCPQPLTEACSHLLGGVVQLNPISKPSLARLMPVPQENNSFGLTCMHTEALFKKAHSACQDPYRLGIVPGIDGAVWLTRHFKGCVNGDTLRGRVARQESSRSGSGHIGLLGLSISPLRAAANQPVK